MFLKLLKHEFRATRNAMMVLCLTALAAGILGGCTMGFMFWAIGKPWEVSDAAQVLCAMVMVFSVMIIAMCGVAVFFLMVWRFYKSCFTDEGYLTFTLPVSTHQVLLSRVLNAALNMLIAVVTVIAAFGILGVIGCSFMEGFWQVVGEMLPELWSTFWNGMTWEIAGDFALLVYDMVIGCASEFIIIMLSITIGALIAKKHKILAAIGVYYGINFVLSIFGGITMLSSLKYITGGIDTFAHVLLVPGVACTILAVVGYFLTYFLVSRKLNLP